MDFNKAIMDVPENYRAEIDGGVIEKIFYTAKADGDNTEKHAYVYLPPCYDEKKAYDIFYFMHGGGDGAESYFFGEGREGHLKNMLDHMIKDGLIKPLIVVTPTFYTGGTDGSIKSAYEHVKKFPDELREDLMPAVEKKYNRKVYDMENSREYRMFGGFSMGSACVWEVLIKSLENFKYFMPISGDCWAVEEYGGGKSAVETAKLLSEVVKKSKYKDNFFIYAVTGTDDVAYAAMKGQIEAMEGFEEFKLTRNEEAGNLAWNVKEGGVHRYESIEKYLYTALPLLFGN
ncbi:MAG: enterochelin esterase [Clostridia bacterium]|nr:enterochelin esterase [Clostridia bacterium]